MELHMVTRAAAVGLAVLAIIRHQQRTIDKLSDRLVQVAPSLELVVAWGARLPFGGGIVSRNEAAEREQEGSQVDGA